MTERLLQFIWQFQYFNKQELSTTDGEEIVVIAPGIDNSNQGPDFLEAKIKIANATWVGTIELHLNASDWNKHQHHHDPNYRNVILHVVWNNDEVASGIPVLELRSRVPKFLLQRYEELIQSVAFIPCGAGITLVKDIIWTNWKDRMLAERLQLKSTFIETLLRQNNYHWEETFWWLLARNYGMRVNADAFEAMARSVPLSVIGKHRNRLDQLEALLFGQAGLLNQPFRESYPKNLKREYRFLKKKHQLSSIHFPVHFLRMRPGNFPTIRLAQLAALLHSTGHLFSGIKEAEAYLGARRFFESAAGEYWHNHYRFDQVSRPMPKHPGSAMVDNIMINTIVPVLFTYGKYHQQPVFKDKAFGWLDATTAENNAITRGFENLGVYCRSAYDSQALISLKAGYCDQRRCLDCAIGNALLRAK